MDKSIQVLAPQGCGLSPAGVSPAPPVVSITAWHAIPQELRDRAQWCYSPPGTKAPYDAKTGYPASVTDCRTWASFDLACAAARYTGGVIGFVLSAADPFSIIDLDVKDDTSPEHLARFKLVVEMFASYTERSTSGRGVHVVVLGSLPDNKGARRDGVEVYNDARYMICTGNALAGIPPQSRQDLLELLVQEMRRGAGNTGHSGWNLPEYEPDETIMRRAWYATNSEKFQKLWRGQWQTNYPSQSEADHALLSMLAFYSFSNSQTMRLFRLSGLGQRPKAQLDSYLLRSIGAIRTRQEIINNHANALSAALVNNPKFQKNLALNKRLHSDS